jgi:hypothetical protein
MANPRPSHRWKKGESGNVRGREKCPDDIVAARKYCRSDIQKSVHALFFQPYIEVKSGLHDRSGSVVDLLLASIIVGAYEHGCKMRLNFLLNLIFGRSPRRLMTSKANTAVSPDEPGPFYVCELSPTGRFLHPRPRKVRCFSE